MRCCSQGKDKLGKVLVSAANEELVQLPSVLAAASNPQEIRKYVINADVCILPQR